MAKFKVIQEDPYKFKEELLNFWEELLPGTPPERLDWMQKNPAGAACWFFAFEEHTGRLAGTISLFPKDLFFEGKRVRAAILGDFMLHTKFRVFGPALALLKAAKSVLDAGDFDFLFTLPNLQSKKIVTRVGLRPAGKVYSMMNPQRSDFVVEKYTGTLLASILDRPLLWTLRVLSRDTYAGGLGCMEEFDWQGDEFDAFCQQLQKKRYGQLTGFYSKKYLDWRYRKNPESGFKVYVFREHAGEAIKGFFVFRSAQNRVKLYDFAALDDNILYKLIKKLNHLCRKEQCRGIYISIYESNPLLNIVKRCCFFDTRDEVEIYTYPERIPGMDHWAFTSSDRNV